MSESYIDIKPDPSLLNANFDGYKLSLDALPIYSFPLKVPGVFFSLFPFLFMLAYLDRFSANFVFLFFMVIQTLLCLFMFDRIYLYGM